MKITFSILALSLFLTPMAYAQSDSAVEDMPVPAQIFPNDPERTQEDSDRNEREMKEYKKRLEESREDPE